MLALIQAMKAALRSIAQKKKEKEEEEEEGKKKKKVYLHPRGPHAILIAFDDYVHTCPNHRRRQHCIPNLSQHVGYSVTPTKEGELLHKDRFTPNPRSRLYRDHARLAAINL